LTLTLQESRPLKSIKASIVGRRFGIHRWSPTSSKTIEGSLAFVVSVFVAAMLLRVVGQVEAFSVSGVLVVTRTMVDKWTQHARYLLALVMSGLLEALSDQNDNLTLPLYMWSMLVIGNV